MSHGRYHLTNVSCGNNSHVWWRFLVHVRLSDVRWASSLKSCIPLRVTINGVQGGGGRVWKYDVVH